MFLNMDVLQGGVVSTSPNPQAGGPPLVGCPRLLIQFIRSYPPYRRLFLYPQPEDTPCRGDRRTIHLEIIDQIYELILEDRRISAKSIAEQLGISREWVGSIIHEDLDMQKLSVKWVLKCLNVDQKCQ